MYAALSLMKTLKEAEVKCWPQFAQSVIDQASDRCSINLLHLNNIYQVRPVVLLAVHVSNKRI